MVLMHVNGCGASSVDHTPW